MHSHAGLQVAEGRTALPPVQCRPHRGGGLGARSCLRAGGRHLGPRLPLSPHCPPRPLPPLPSADSAASELPRASFLRPQTGPTSFLVKVLRCPQDPPDAGQPPERSVAPTPSPSGPCPRSGPSFLPGAPGAPTALTRAPRSAPRAGSRASAGTTLSLRPRQTCPLGLSSRKNASSPFMVGSGGFPLA